MSVIKYLCLFLLVLNFQSCTKKKKDKLDVSNIEASTEITRFEQKFYSGGIDQLANLKSDFPYLFPEPNPDSVWIAKMKDEDELFLYRASQEAYPDFRAEKEGLDELFRHVKYYYPKFTPPRTITILSNIDYDNSVVYADSLLFISLDAYLGKAHDAYQDYPNYIKQNFTREHLLVDVAEKISDPILRPPVTNSYVSRMIQEGKRLYLMAAFLPEVDAAEMMGYEQEQLRWAILNESDIWKYFIENELLYSNEVSLAERFINEAPFSKFFLEVDKDSPGRIGAWFGWQIVNSFMEHNDMSLQEMVVTDNEEIFKRSRYKPKKS